MARDFGVEKQEYKNALEEIRNIELSESYWNDVVDSINQESKRSYESAERQKADNEFLNKFFSI